MELRTSLTAALNAFIIHQLRALQVFLFRIHYLLFTDIRGTILQVSPFRVKLQFSLIAPTHFENYLENPE